ncbi:MAG: CPBP family intramembrane metalloprotease [Ruminiclostridium sp.]|nr:CPBP family intramembrane metalloprotease [Ruminiclostridium sp.]
MNKQMKPLYAPKFWWSLLHVLIYFGISLLLSILVTFVVTIVIMFRPVAGMSIEDAVMRFLSNSLINGIMSIAIIGLFAVIISIRHSLEVKTLYSRRYLSASVLIVTVITTIGASILTSEVDNFMRTLIPNWDLMGAGIIEMFDNSPVWQNFFAAVIVAPVTEEFLVRGMWLRGYTKHYKPWVGVVISSVIFGLLHLNLPQFVGATMSGLLLGWAYIKTNSIMLPMLIHAVHNSLSLFGGVVSIPGFSAESATGYQPLWFDALGLVMFLGGIFVLNKLLIGQRQKIMRPRIPELAEEM